MAEREQPLAQDVHPSRSGPEASLWLQMSKEAPLGFGLAILGLMLLAWFGLLGWGSVLAGALSLLGFLLGWARLRLGPFVGPLYFYELLRLARRGRTTLLRFAYGLALLALLCYFYAEHFPDRDLLEQAFAPGWNLSRSSMARFSHHFVIAFLIVQSIAIYVLTPIYLGGAIAEEKERRTLELLLTTHLRDHEIVFGKLLARLTHLLLLLLMGVPILCLTSLMGGVHYLLLVAGFVATLVSLLTLGCLSICISVLSRTSLGAISGTYGVLLVFLCGIVCLGSPASLVVALEDVLKEGSPLDPLEATLTHVGIYTLVHGLIGAFCAYGAVAQLRLGGDLPPLSETIPPPRLVPVSPVFDEALPPAGPPPRPPAVKAMVHIAYPRLLDEEPLLWKEAYRGTGELESTFGCAILGMFVYFLAVLLPFAASFPSVGMSWQQGLNRALRIFFVLLMTAWSVLTALRTVGSLSRERDQRTLDALLTLPFSHRAILRACWAGGIARFRHLGYCLAVCLLVGLLSGAFHPLSVVLMVLAASASLTLLAGMGVWLALATRTTLWAYVSMALILLVFFGGAWALLFCGSGAGGWEESPAAWHSHLIQVGLNPLAAWWVAGFSCDDLADLDAVPLFRAHLQAVHTGIGILGLLAWLLWHAALHRLHSRLKKAHPPPTRQFRPVWESLTVKMRSSVILDKMLDPPAPASRLGVKFGKFGGREDLGKICGPTGTGSPSPLRYLQRQKEFAMKKLLVMTAVAAVVALVTSGTAQARHGHGGGGCGSCGSMGGGCGYGGGFGGCGYGGGYGCGYGGCSFGGCGYGGGMMMGGCGTGGCGYGGTIMGGCGTGGCGYAGGFSGIGSYAMAADPASQEAVVVVALPEDAVLTVDGQATTSTSTERVFRTPDLEAGKDFHYTLKARYVQNGKQEQITRTITVRSGEVTRIDLNTPAAASTETAMAR